MFNLFPEKKSVNEILEDNKVPSTNWFFASTPTFTVNGITYRADELSKYISELLAENQKLKNELNDIEEDGTKEHNEAIKLREENAQLKLELENWKRGVTAWRAQCDQEVAKNTKLEDEITEYKKGNKNWMNLYQEVVDKNNELLKEIKHLSYLKEKNVELIDRVNEIDSDQNEEYRAEVFRLRNDNAVWKAKYGTLLEKYNGTVTKGGLKYMEAKLQIVQNNYKKCASERDEYKTSFERMKRACEQEAKSANSELVKRIELEKEYEVRLKELNNGLVDVTRENKKFCKIIEDQKAEIEKLKKDIIDYVFEKDEEKSQYPIHWGGYDGAASAHPEEYKKWLYEQGDKAIDEKKQKEVGFAKSLPDAPVQYSQFHDDMYYQDIYSKSNEDARPCPCNKCKEHRQVSYDLEQRINKLENQVKEIKLLKDYVKGNHRI